MKPLSRAEIANMLHQAFQQVHLDAKQFIADELPDPEEEQLKKFGAWCRTQRPGKTYNYMVPPVCAIGQWYRSMGYVYTNPYGHGLLEYFAKIKPHTYGALAKRIEGAGPMYLEIARCYN